jgi:hypothetical protein
MGDTENIEVHKGETLASDVTLLGGPFVNALMNPDGSPRGGVSVHSRVADSAFVDAEATVLGGVEVDGNAQVRGRSIVGAGTTIRGNAVVNDVVIVPMTETNPDARVDISGNALVEHFSISGLTLKIFGDAWVCGLFESQHKNGLGKLVTVRGGYRQDELLDGGRYGGSQGGTGRADLLSDDGVTALQRWLLSLPVDVRKRYPEETMALRERTGKNVEDTPVTAPVFRMVNSLGGRYVVPLRSADLHRVEDLLKCGAVFPEVASLYEMDDDTLFVALEEHVGYNPFAHWKKFVERPLQAQYTIHVPASRSLLYSQWRAVNPLEQEKWEKERRDITDGLLYELDDIKHIQHASKLDRPDRLVWEANFY